MSQLTYGQLAVKPVVAALLERALWFANASELEHAAAFYRAAVAADLTPASRLIYGVFLADREREVAARIQLLEAWEMAKRAGDSLSRALACHNLAALHRRQGQPLVAKSYQQLAIAACLDLGPTAMLPEYILSGVALDLVECEPVVAEDLLNAVTLDEEESVSGWLNRGVLAYRRGAARAALRWFHRAFEKAQSLADYNTCAAALTNLAHLKREQGHWATADECLALAQKIHEQAERPREVLRQSHYRRELRPGLVLLATIPEWN
ncbi:MAG: hypothetical protein DWH91_13080 [Planctomycetota bacterium]|nr:MAG: hypothetical protein DWH91_13080 [Planctomycetota bacterium]